MEWLLTNIKTLGQDSPVKSRHCDPLRIYLDMRIPLGAELLTEIVQWQSQGIFTDLTGLLKAERMEQMDLTMREPRFHSLLQQLHHVLERNVKKFMTRDKTLTIIIIVLSYGDTQTPVLNIFPGKAVKNLIPFWKISQI